MLNVLAEPQLGHLWASDQERLNSLTEALENAVEGISLLDGAGKYVSLNRAYAEMLGYLPEELIGKSWEETVYPEDRQKIYFAYQHMLDHGKAEAEGHAVRKDGSLFYKQVVMVKALGTHGELVGHHCFMMDISDRKRLEEQLRQSQKMEAVGQLASGVAHDLNNLLTIIMGYSDLLLDALEEDDPDREVLEEIRKAGEQSASLARQLLAFSRKQAVTPQVLSLNDLVLNAEAMLRRVIGEDI